MIKTDKLKRDSSIKINNRQWFCCKTPLLARQDGAVLIVVVVTMLIMASLGAGMVHMTTTSTYQEFFVNKGMRARYAAESGGRYAVSVIREALATGTPDIDTVPATFFSNEYTMINTDRFNITNWIEDTSSGSMVITFDSIGTSGSGFLQAKRKLRYRLNPSNQTGSGTPIPEALPLGVSDFDVDKQDLDTYFGPVAMSEVDIKNTIQTDGDNALNLKSEDYTMGLKWDHNSSLAQLDAIRASNSDLLSYGVQVKIKINDTSPFNMVGISFRLDDESNGTANFDNMYGISFVKFDVDQAKNKNAIPDWYKDYIRGNNDWDLFSEDNNGYWFVVLWKRIIDGNTQFTPLAYQNLMGDPVCDDDDGTGCTTIAQWATIMVYIEEMSTGSNEITGYLSQPPTYERSTTALFQPIQWAEEDGGPDSSIVPSVFEPIDWTLVTGTGATLQSATFDGITHDIVTDNSLTTSNYDSYTIGNTTQTKAREIGLHIFYDSTSAQNVFYDNFYIDLSPSADEPYYDGEETIEIGG